MTEAQPDPALLDDAARLGNYAIELQALFGSLLTNEVISASSPVGKFDTGTLLVDTARQLRLTDVKLAAVRSIAHSSII